MRTIPIVAAASLALEPGLAQAQWAGSNTTGSRGLIAIDKLGNQIRFYDPETLKEVKAFEAPGKSVHELTISYDHKRAYVPLYGDGIYPPAANPNPNNKIAVIDLETQALEKVIDLGQYVAPHGIAATRDGKLWVACDRQLKLLLVDPAKGAIEAVYDTGGKGPHFLALLPDDSKLYLSNKESDVAVFDTRSRAFVARVPVGRAGVTAGAGSGSEGLTPTPDGRQVIVADNDRGDLRVIDARTDKEVARIPLAGYPPSNP
jgi:YVTN family beta-propeller protein